MKLRRIANKLLIVALLLLPVHQSLAFSVMIENKGIEDIRYLYFQVENGDTFFYDGPSPGKTAMLPPHILKKLKNTKTHVSAFLTTSIPSCGIVDFKEEYEMRIVMWNSNHGCRASY